MTANRILLVVVVAAVLGACGGAADDAGDQIVVSAAASLTDAFSDMEAAFESAHPGTDVVVNLGGSSALREQIIGGAPVDVFASASESIMDEVVAAGEVSGDPAVFAVNTIQIAVPMGNPGGVAGPADLAREGLFIGLCAEGVPCGDLAREALDRSGVVPAIDTNEPDVRSLLTKLESSELDAGIVYATDLLATDGVGAVAWPGGPGVATSYVVAVLAGAPNGDGAARFRDFVLSDVGRAVLSSHGFTLP